MSEKGLLQFLSVLMKKHLTQSRKKKQNEEDSETQLSLKQNKNKS